VGSCEVVVEVVYDSPSVWDILPGATSADPYGLGCHTKVALDDVAVRSGQVHQQQVNSTDLKVHTISRWFKLWMIMKWNSINRVLGSDNQERE